MERNSSKSGLYEIRIEKAITFTPSEGDIQTHAEIEVQYVLVKNFKNFLVYLHEINVTPEVVGLTYNKIDNSVLVL